jgi:hypothetical protein
MKLNLCCGTNHLKEDFINVDKQPAASPDVLFDLETFPWIWKENSVSEIRLNHALEHLGETTEKYKQIIQELYRVCRHGAEITIVVPFYRHDNAVSDPTHVRVITPLGLAMLSKRNNEEWIAERAANTPLAIYWNVNFETSWVRAMADETMWKRMFPTLLKDDLAHQNKLWEYSHINNLICELHFQLVAIKE